MYRKGHFLEFLVAVVVLVFTVVGAVLAVIGLWLLAILMLLLAIIRWMWPILLLALVTYVFFKNGLI